MKKTKAASEPSAELVAFVRSRLPMLIHDRAFRSAGTDEVVARGRRAAGSYSFRQAFFYQAEWWVNRPPRVSRAALNHAKKNWPDEGRAIWTARRTDVVKHEGRRISDSGLIWEHVYTGTMFERALDRLFEKSKTLDPVEVARVLNDNFQTAWITREEDENLPRSVRGETLVDALIVYESEGIELVEPPDSNDAAVSTSSFDLVEPSPSSKVPGRNLQAAYNAFFERLGKATKSRASDLSLTHRSGRHYAYVERGDYERGIPEVCVELRGPKRSKDVYVSIAFPAAAANAAPTHPAWLEMVAQLGEGGELLFGKHDRKEGLLCRYRVKIAEGFTGALGKNAVRAAADRAAEALLASDLSMAAMRSVLDDSPAQPGS
jgi:hypothetical protein